MHISNFNWFNRHTHMYGLEGHENNSIKQRSKTRQAAIPGDMADAVTSRQEGIRGRSWRRYYTDLRGELSVQVQGSCVIRDGFIIRTNVVMGGATVEVRICIR